MLISAFTMIALLQYPPVSPAQAYPSVLSQNPIQWISNAPQGISLAQATDRPLLFYIPPSETLHGIIFGHDVGDVFGTFTSDITNAQNVAFRDPIVKAFAEDRFVPVRLQRTNHTLPVLAAAGLPTTYGSYLAAFTPDGKYIGWITPSEAADPRVLAMRLSDLYRRYRLALYRHDVRPVLENEAATPAELGAALSTIRDFMILDADQDVTELLTRPALNRNVEKEAIDTLAVLSTPDAVDTLVHLAGTNRIAAEALNRLTLPAAEHMLSIVDLNDPAQVAAVYDAAVKIAGIDDPKLRPFWSRANLAARQRELARVEAVLKPQAQRWHEVIGVLR
jgi:hypothetical protein